MARYPTTNPFEDIIADGRVLTQPAVYYDEPDILEFDMESAYNLISDWLHTIFSYEESIRNHDQGSARDVTSGIQQGARAITTFALGVTYNRLRHILEQASPTACNTRMNPRCPVNNHMLFPTWLSSTLSCIGPCRATDGLTDRKIVWATRAANMNHYSRDAALAFNDGKYDLIMSALRACNIPLAPIDLVNSRGSFFPTIEPEALESKFHFYAAFHHTHYENEDLLRIALFTHINGETPFEKTAMTVGYVNDKTTLNALGAVTTPSVPAGQTATSAGRPCYATYPVNYFGIQPAVNASGTQPARRRGAYIIGRGMERGYHHVLTRNLNVYEIRQALRFRLLSGLNPATPPQPNP